MVRLLGQVGLILSICLIIMKHKYFIYFNEQGRLSSFSNALVRRIDSNFVPQGDDKNIRVSLRMRKICLRDAILTRDSNKSAMLA